MVGGVFSIALGVSEASADRVRSDAPTTLPLRQFIGGRENAVVPLAVQAVLDPLPVYQPVVLTGPSCIGKTLLAQLLVQLWKERQAAGRALVLSGADFARAASDAVETGDQEDWRLRCRSAGLFVLDGLHQLCEKPRAQIELAYLIEERANDRLPTVVTSRTPPRSLVMLSQRLNSRLVAGLLVPLAHPGPAARRVILEQLCRIHDLHLSPSVAQLLLDDTSRESFPQLSGALLQLKAAAEHHDEPLDAPLARKVLTSSPTPAPTLQTITATVAKFTGIRLQDLRGPSRRKSIVRARDLAIYLARQLTGASFERLGQYFGRRDHTTTLHAYRKLDSLLKQDAEVRQMLDQLNRLLATATKSDQISQTAERIAAVTKRSLATRQRPGKRRTG